MMVTQSRCLLLACLAVIVFIDQRAVGEEDGLLLRRGSRRDLGSSGKGEGPHEVPIKFSSSSSPLDDKVSTKGIGSGKLSSGKGKSNGKGSTKGKSKTSKESSSVPSDMPSLVPSDEPSFLPSMNPSNLPTTTPCGGPCDDGNLCTVDFCDTVADTCGSEPVECGSGEACDPFTGRCQDVQNIVPCIGVIDEWNNRDYSTIWADFRAQYPQRPFCLLVPSTIIQTL